MGCEGTGEPSLAVDAALLYEPAGEPLKPGLGWSTGTGCGFEDPVGSSPGADIVTV